MGARRLGRLWWGMGGCELQTKFTPPATGRAAPLQVRMFVDFDGTIALEDTTDVILERFALPEWRVVEADWVAGLIGSRECLARQVDMIRARPDDLDDVAR